MPRRLIRASSPVASHGAGHVPPTGDRPRPARPPAGDARTALLGRYRAPGHPAPAGAQGDPGPLRLRRARRRRGLGRARGVLLAGTLRRRPRRERGRAALRRCRHRHRRPPGRRRHVDVLPARPRRAHHPHPPRRPQRDRPGRYHGLPRLLRARLLAPVPVRRCTARLVTAARTEPGTRTGSERAVPGGDLSRSGGPARNRRRAHRTRRARRAPRRRSPSPTRSACGSARSASPRAG